MPRLLVLLACACSLSVARAQFATGFEAAQSSGSPSYVAGGTIIGVQDVAVPAGSKWMNLFGSSSTNLTLTSNNPAAGALALQIKDTSETVANGAYLNLAGTSNLDLTQPFTLSFALNLSSISSATDNQVQVYLGAPSTDMTANKYWAVLFYHNGALVLYVSSASGTGATAVTLGTYSTFDKTGSSYVRVSISIDPVLKKYTNVTLSGSGVTTDCTDLVRAVNGGVVPWLPNVNPTVSPDANLVFVTGKNDTVTAKFDDIRITPASQWFEAYAPGVILPDQGTIEMTLSLSRPITQMGNSTGYDFLFKMLPAQKLSNGGRTLMGMYIPSAGGGTGLFGLVRNGTTATSSIYINNATFSPPMGQLVRVAMSWGSMVKLYVNGALVASGSSTIGNIAPMPARFRVERLDPFCVSEVKVSDVALATASLSANPATAMKSDAATTMLATGGLTRTQYFHSRRLGSLGFTALTPQWRAEDQSLVEGMTPVYTVLGINHSSAIKTYSVNIVATDRSGMIVSNTTTSVPVAADNTHHLTALPLAALATRGYYTLKTTITASGVSTATYANTIAVYPAHDTSVADGAWDHYLGHQYPIEDYSPVVLTRMGLKTNRVFSDLSGFYWFAVQPNSGTGSNGFTWARTDQVVQQATAAGIDLLGVLGNPPPWAAEDPGATYKQTYSSFSKMSGRWKPRDGAEWGNYVNQVVSRYKGQVKNWEIWNEVDWHPSFPYYSFSGTTAEYHNLLKIAYTQAKAVDTGNNVLMSGFGLVPSADSNMPYDLLNAGAATSFDTFASHGYDNTQVDALNTALYAKKGANAPHWMTEQMWDSVSYEKDRLYLTLYLYLRYLDQGVGRFYQFGFEPISFDPFTQGPLIDGYVQGVFQGQLRKAETYRGKYSFNGSNAFGVRHYFTRKDGKTLSFLGQELTRNVVTVSGAILSATDCYGKPITTTVSGSTTALDIADVAAIVSTSSLTITGVKLLEAAPLMLNTGFEDLSGDLQTGGLVACSPLYWTLRATTYDPNGAIALTNSSVHGGRYAMSVTSSGAGPVYLFQDAPISQSGPYKITAWIRRPNASDTAVPYLAIYNRDAGVVTQQAYSGIVAGGDYTQVTYTYTFSSAQTQSAAIMGGITTGEGTILIDDMKFEYVGMAPPGKVSSVTAGSGTAAGEVSLNWTAVAGASSYLIERSTSSTSGFVQVSEVTAPTLTFVDEGNRTTAPLYYRVKAWNPAGTAAASSVVAATAYLPAGIDGWRYINFGTVDEFDPIAGDLAMPNGDDIPNLTAYALGLSVQTPNSPTSLPSARVTTIAGAPYLTYTFTHGKSVSGVAITVEVASDPNGPWSAIDPFVSGNQLSVLNNTPSAGVETITAKDSQPISASGMRFARLRITRM